MYQTHSYYSLPVLKSSLPPIRVQVVAAVTVQHGYCGGVKNIECSVGFYGVVHEAIGIVAMVAVGGILVKDLHGSTQVHEAEEMAKLMLQHARFERGPAYLAKSARMIEDRLAHQRYRCVAVSKAQHRTRSIVAIGHQYIHIKGGTGCIGRAILYFQHSYLVYRKAVATIACYLCLGDADAAGLVAQHIEVGREGADGTGIQAVTRHVLYLHIQAGVLAAAQQVVSRFTERLVAIGIGQYLGVSGSLSACAEGEQEAKENQGMFHHKFFKIRGTKFQIPNTKYQITNTKYQIPGSK